MSANQNKKTFDVAHPGKTAPSATSRPIIVGHGPMMHDPMMQDADTSKTKVNIKSTIQPISENIEPAAKKVIEPPARPEIAKDSLPDEPEIKKSEPDNSNTEKSEETNTDTSDDSSATAVVDSVVGQAADKKAQAAADSKELERQTHVAELVASKKYFVPINVAKRRRSSRLFVWMLLLFALTAAATAYMLQTGLIEL